LYRIINHNILKTKNKNNVNITKEETASISIILPHAVVLSDGIEDSPEFLPEINPKKNGLKISDKSLENYGEGRSFLRVCCKKSNYLT
jgi:hypothetical protein